MNPKNNVAEAAFTSEFEEKGNVERMLQFTILIRESINAITKSVCFNFDIIIC
jgi:hypothetical protein